MSSMKILRKLPPAPKTATKPVYDPKYVGVGRHLYIHKPNAPLEGFPPDKKAIINGHKTQTETARRKREMVKNMALAGAEYAEISEATGYKIDSVRRIVRLFREDGVHIPERKRGRKKDE